MAFPQVASITEYKGTALENDHALTMPATVNAGDLLFIIVASTNTTALFGVSTPSGWTSEFTKANNGNETRVQGLKKIAVGDEDGTTLHLITGSSGTAYVVAQIYRITDWAGDLTNYIKSATNNSNADSTPDPPSVTWTSALDYLWIAGTAKSSTHTLSSYSTNYTNGLYTYNALSDSQSQLASERRERNVASENPGQLTISGATDVVNFTVSIGPTLSFSQNITPTKVSHTPTIPTPTFSFGEVSRFPTKLNVALTFYTPTGVIQTFLNPTLLDLTPSFGLPAMLIGNNAAPTVIDNILYIIPTASFVPGSVTRTPVKLDLSIVFYNSEIANVLQPSKLDVSVSIPNPTLAHAASPSAIERDVNSRINTPTFQLLPTSISPAMLDVSPTINTPDMSNPGWANTDVYSTETWADTDILM